MTDYKLSGLDMAETISWYSNSEVILPPLFLGHNLAKSVENKELIELSRRDLGTLFDLFPVNSRSRSILRKVVGQPTTWFDKASLDGKPTPTTDESNAISPTAIIPSYIDYREWQKTGIPTADIWLYKLPGSIPPNVRRLITAEGFVHEVSHSVVQPALYVDSHNLRFPDGRIVNGLEAMLEFAKLAEQHPPISHYASAYRTTDNKFKGGDNQGTAISEEFCETVAAHLLGFAFCRDEQRGKNPFADRPKIKSFVASFLNAELVT